MKRDIETLLATKAATVEAYLATLPRGEDGLLKDSMAYSLQGGGKRLRPCLFLLTAELYGGEESPLLPFAAAIEMIHTYSLVHDDLPAMDDDDYRRGRLTNHRVFGEGQAILAGDALLTEAFYLMASLRETFPPRRVLDAIAVGADLAGIGGMVRGQVADIEGEGKELTLAELKAIHRDKTAALIRFALMSAAILRGAPAGDVEALSRYGHGIGLAFQIVDDILDTESTFEELGKPIGSDAEKDKTTYVTLLGADAARAEAAAAIAAAKAALADLSVDAAPLSALADTLLTRKK